MLGKPSSEQTTALMHVNTVQTEATWFQPAGQSPSTNQSTHNPRLRKPGLLGLAGYQAKLVLVNTCTDLSTMGSLLDEKTTWEAFGPEPWGALGRSWEPWGALAGESDSDDTEANSTWTDASPRLGWTDDLSMKDGKPRW